MKFLFALLGVALAAHSYLPQSNPLSSETEYRFRYDAILTSGLPIPSSEGAITRLRSEVIIQMTEGKVGRLQLRKPEIASEKKYELSNELVSMDKLEKRPLLKEHERLLQLPMRFHYKNGIVSELQFSEEDMPWSANIKRAVVNMIQMNLNKATSDEENTWENGYFTASETTIEGECEMAYTIVKEQQKTLVTKSVNYEKCERRADLAYNQRFVSECPECDYKMIVPQTVYNYKLNKQQIEEVGVRSVYTVALKEQPLMKTETRARLTLLEQSEIRREIETPKGEIEELMYSNQYERTVDKFFRLGDEVEEKPFEQFSNKVEQIKEFVSRIAELSENEPETVHMFTRIVRHLRMCSEQELRSVHERVYQKSEQKQKTIIEHALAVAGTKNTVQHLFRHNEQISPVKFAQLLKSIQETSYPSEKIAHMLQKLAESENVRREPVIRQSAWLAYGAVVRGTVVPTQEKTAYRHEKKDLKEKFVSTMEQLYKKSESVYEKVLAIKTIANAGIDTSIRVLEKIIMDKKEPTIIRMEAIDALRHLSEQMPRKIQKVLMPIYSNRLEKNEIRMAALNQLVMAKPQLPELSQVVSRMEREPNQHVAAFTYHVLYSISESTLPSYRNVSEIASTLLRNSQFRPESRILSIYKRLPLYSEESFSGLSFNLGSIIGKDSVIPKDMMASLETVFGGNWNKYLAQIGFSQQNVEALFNKVLSKLNKLEKKENYSRASRVSKSISALKEIARQLNIRTRESTTEEPYAMLYIRYKQMDYAVLPIDEQYLNELIEKYVREGTFDMKALERFFDRKPEFEFTHAGHLFESFYKYPTIIGVPLTISTKMPTVFSATGKVSLEKISYGMKANIKAQPSAASTHIQYMSVWCPVFEHGLKLVRSTQLSTPVHVEVEVSYKKEIEVELRLQNPEEKKTLLRLESRPVSFVRIYRGNNGKYTESEEHTISLPKLERMGQEWNEKREMGGLEYVFSGVSYSIWNRESVLLGEHQAQITVIPNRRTPKEVSARFVIDSSLTKTRMEEPKIEKMIRREMPTEMGELESRTETTRRDHLNKLVSEMELKNAYKHRIQCTFRGVEKTEVELRTECDGKYNFWRFHAEVKPEDRSSEWNMWTKTELVLPRTVASVEELKELKHREVQLYSEWKWGSEEKVEMSAQWEQSKMQRNMVQTIRQLRGVPAYEHLYRLARLNQVQAQIDYKLSSKYEKKFEELFSVLKAYTYWSSQQELAENEPRRISLQITSEPMVWGLYNMTIQTPECSFRAQSVRMPYVPASVQYWMMPTIARQPKNSLRQSPIVKSECKIEESRVNTFDDAIFRAPLSTCYTVVAKDCSEEPRYAVLVKNVRKNSEEKKVKIIFEESEYELEVSEGELKAIVDKKTIRREAELEQYNIEKIGDMYVVDLGELVIRFDGYTVKVLLNNGEMKNQCGLCGHFDGEKNEWRTAKNEEAEDLEEFHRSYILKTEECSADLPEKKQYKEYSYDESSSEEEYQWPENKRNWQSKKNQKSSEEEDKDYESRSETENKKPEQQIRIQEFSHKMCFSLEPVPTCPKNWENSKTVEKKVRFGCLPRQSSETRKMVAAVRRGELINTSELQISFVDSMLVPETCIVY